MCLALNPLYWGWSSHHLIENPHNGCINPYYWVLWPSTTGNQWEFRPQYMYNSVPLEKVAFMSLVLQLEAWQPACWNHLHECEQQASHTEWSNGSTSNNANKSGDSDPVVATTCLSNKVEVHVYVFIAIIIIVIIMIITPYYLCYHFYHILSLS